MFTKSNWVLHGWIEHAIIDAPLPEALISRLTLQLSCLFPINAEMQVFRIRIVKKIVHFVRTKILNVETIALFLLVVSVLTVAIAQHLLNRFVQFQI